MRWSLRDDPALARSALLAVAIGVTGNSYFLLGLSSGAAFGSWALVFPALVALALVAIIGIGVRAVLPAAPLPRLAFVAACGVLLALLVGLALVPPIARDEMTHHLALPALYVAAGRIVEVPFADQGYYPMLLEMFYTPLLAWLPDQTPKFVHLLFGLASASVVGLAAKRQGGEASGAIAFALILFTPVVALLACTAYVDLGLLFYTAVAIAALLRWYDTGSWAWLVLAALNAGFSGTSKYNGLVSIALLAVGAVLAPHVAPGASVLVGRDTPTAPAGEIAPARAATAPWWQQTLRVALVGGVFGLVALVPMSPWLGKNWVQTGNPTFPLFRGIFGGRASLAPGGAGIDVFTRRRLLYDESWADIAAIPARIFTTGRDGDPSRFDGVLCPLMLIGIAAALRRRTSREQRLLLAFAAAYFGIAFFQASLRVRYILPIVPPLALITASALAEILRRQRAVGATLLAAGFLFASGHVAEKWREIEPLAYISGRVSRAEYVSQFVRELPVVAYANQTLPAGARLYLAFLGTRSYYVRRPFTYDYYFSGVTLRRYLESSGDSSQVLAHFKGDGITHMIAEDELLGRYLTDNLDTPTLERWQMFAANHLTRETSAQGVSLYAIN